MGSNFRNRGTSESLHSLLLVFESSHSPLEIRTVVKNVFPCFRPVSSAVNHEKSEYTLLELSCDLYISR